MLTPLQLYQADLQRPDFIADAAQQNAVHHIQRLYDELVKPAEKPQTYLAKLQNRWRKPTEKKTPIRGLYFWGGVGRGKTYLIDTFCDCLPFEQKLRVHFHRFMQQVHHELSYLKNKQNPLTLVARRFAEQTRIICLDEFHVSDITDAMLLGVFLKALFEQGVTLVATSNIEPDGLYKNGLQRDRFLPAIALLKQYTQVVNVDNGVDYRLRTLERAEIYHYPLGDEADQMLLNSFKHIAPDEGLTNTVLEINNRLIKTLRCADGVVWFEFAALCDIPRDVSDYIELARCFNTVFISNIHSMGEADNDRALRLINLVDEFYDRNVKLIISAQVPPEQLYTGTRQAFQFQRTISRLEEMRSQTYLQRPHLP